jgi:hypothetical protein
MKPPRNHIDHFYWTSGVQAWASMKFPGETPVLPPEVAAGEEQFPRDDADARMGNAEGRLTRLGRPLVQSYIDFIGAVRRRVGVIPDVPIWHHLWLDSRLILNWVNSIAGHAGQKNALVCDDTSHLILSLPKHMPIEVCIRLQDLAPGIVERLSGAGVSHEAGGLSDGALADQKFDNILVHVRRSEVLNLKKILEWAENSTKPAGTIAVYLEHRNSEEDQGNFSTELAQYVQNLLPANWLGLHLTASFAGGRTKRGLRLKERFLFRFLWPSSLARMPLSMLMALLWSVVAGLTALNNFRLRNRSSECLDYCSSALLRVSNRPEVNAASSSEGRRTAA